MNDRVCIIYYLKNPIIERNFYKLGFLKCKGSLYNMFVDSEANDLATQQADYLIHCRGSS